jgi:hypothetical protein
MNIMVPIPEMTFGPSVVMIRSTVVFNNFSVKDGRSPTIPSSIPCDEAIPIWRAG